MSYIKRKPEPVNLDSSMLLYLKSLFSIHTTRKLSNIKILANINESFFSMKMKNDFYWAKKGDKVAIKKYSILWLISKDSCDNLKRLKNNFLYGMLDQILNVLRIHIIAEEFYINRSWYSNFRSFIINNVKIHRSRNVAESYHCKDFNIDFPV